MYTFFEYIFFPILHKYYWEDESLPSCIKKGERNYLSSLPYNKKTESPFELYLFYFTLLYVVVKGHIPWLPLIQVTLGYIMWQKDGQPDRR